MERDWKDLTGDNDKVTDKIHIVEINFHHNGIPWRVTYHIGTYNGITITTCWSGDTIGEGSTPECYVLEELDISECLEDAADHIEHLNG